MRVRPVAWTLLIGAAAVETYTRRFAMSPDGISYLDLSDAVVRGHPSEMINAYWSPLYPALIGAGMLAKSFMVPWTFVFLIVLAAAVVGRGGARPIVIAGTCAAIIAGPWSAVISRRVGHASFGETGKLTYAWFVNDQEPPWRG